MAAELTWRRFLVAGVMVVGLTSACAGGAAPGSEGDRPTVIVTSAVVATQVRTLVGSEVSVEMLASDGADPHTTRLSARQLGALDRADAVVISGAGIEASIQRHLDAVADDGVAIHALADGIDDLLAIDGHVDPHFSADPLRLADAVPELADFLVAHLPELAPSVVDERARMLMDQLEELVDELAQALSPIPNDQRVLISDHRFLDYFADRFGFRAVAVTDVDTSAADAASVARVVEELEAAPVRVLFTDGVAPGEVARTLIADVDGLSVVELFVETLDPASGGGDYVATMRANVTKVLAALTGQAA